ncbi:MAG: HupE/UreJ family protein [Solimonas sp.]
MKRALLLLLPMLLLPAWPGYAHEVRPAYLEIDEAGDGTLQVLWKQPVVGSLSVPVRPQLSAGWLDGKARRSQTDAYLIEEWTIAPPHAALAGQTLYVAGLERTITDVLVRLQYANGVSATQLLKPGQPRWQLPPAEQPSLPLADYFGLGVTHIWTGVDHLLYVFGLMLLVGDLRRLVKTITAFTLAHSLTLACAALDLINLPPAPVEAVIALSIVYVAVELVHKHRGRAGLAQRRPWLVAFSFGLLHGLGFAGALAQIGLPHGDIPLALLLFNLGIEAGQLLFVAAIALGGLALARTLPRLLPYLRPLPAYAIGALASFWFIERTLAFL